MKEMAPEEALELLYVMSRAAAGNATDHENAQRALLILRAVLAVPKKDTNKTAA